MQLLYENTYVHGGLFGLSEGNRIINGKEAERYKKTLEIENKCVAVSFNFKGN